MNTNEQPLAPSRKLPDRANLEQLKKQAKDLLAAFRAGDPVAVAEVEHFVAPASGRPASTTVAESSAIHLHDAQLAVARSYGFASWTKLKEHVSRATVRRLAEAVQRRDAAEVRSLLGQRPELVNMELAENDERTALHHAVLAGDAEMTRLLMRAGADARKGVYPHREATTAHALASERGDAQLLAIIEAEEQHRREAMSCPNATISPVQDEINEAIRAGENARAKQLLEADESLLRACDREGATPLHIAAQVANEEMVAWLLERNVALRKEDARGLAPLDRAALGVDPRNDRLARFPRIARMLLARGAELNLRAAVALGDAARVREICAADPQALHRKKDWVRDGYLTLAVRHGQIEMARLLLDLGADVDERQTLDLDEQVFSWGAPLWYAAAAGRADMAELLLDRGADPNGNVYASGWPLDHAYQRNDSAMKNLLLSRGAKAQPWTICGAGDTEAARRMMEADSSEETAKEFVWSACDHGRPEILRLALPLLDWPRSDPRWHWVMIQPSRGCLGDKRADRESFFECQRLLLERVDPNVTSRFGQVTLHFIAAYSPMGGESPGSGAERARFAAMFVEAGARLDLRDEMLRSTPLGWAARWGRLEMVQLLLDRGAPAHEADAAPWAQPLAWAQKRGHEEIAALLRAAGRS